jgi:hypothetical protein
MRKNYLLIVLFLIALVLNNVKATDKAFPGSYIVKSKSENDGKLQAQLEYQGKY